MQSDYIEEFAFAKLNLSFKVLKKLPNNFHQIESYITFLPNIYDHLIIKKSLQNKIFINGKFANDFVSEIKAGSPEFNRLRKEGSEHLIESTGKKLRSMMSWMDGDKLVGDK